MTGFSMSMSRCPKCFSPVTDEALMCPHCGFYFASLDHPAPAAAKPAKARAPDFAPNLNKEIPFRWSPDQDKTAKKTPRWPRVLLLLSLAAIVSLIGFASLAAWIAPAAGTLIIGTPEAEASQLAIERFYPFVAARNEGLARKTASLLFNETLKLQSSPPASGS
ncbi:MAG: zinc ribbon domain-containing protein [Elusimicrobiota bacterium]